MTDQNGNRPPNEVRTDVTLFDFDNFTVHPATFYIKEMDLLEVGYAVVYKEDGVTQLYSPSILGALQHVMYADQALTYVAAVEEAKTLEGNTEGLLGDALPGPDDVVN